jgi:hypothetical protein
MLNARRSHGAVITTSTAPCPGEVAEEVDGVMTGEPLATARLTGATLVISEVNFGGQMPAQFRPAAEAVGVEFSGVST